MYLLKSWRERESPVAEKRSIYYDKQAWNFIILGAKPLGLWSCKFVLGHKGQIPGQEGHHILVHWKNELNLRVKDDLKCNI